VAPGVAVADSALGGAPGTRSAAAARSTAGAPVASARAGFTHGLVEGVGPPPFRPLPPTQAEIDAKWRDQAFEVAAARGAGVPVRMTTAAGGVSVPLPFGGPSKKQRERDRAIEAELKVSRALRQQRIDSVLAARKHRLADSGARVSDSPRNAAATFAIAPQAAAQSVRRCRAADNTSERLIVEVKSRIAATDSEQAADRDTLFKIPVVDVDQISLVTDETTCLRAASAYGSQPGSTAPTRVYVVKLGSKGYAVLDPDQPAGEYRIVMILSTKFAVIGGWTG
jgi:hypothetical protein